MKIARTLLAAPAAFAALLSVWAGPAFAGDLTASATQNLSPPVTNASGGASVGAQFLVGSTVVAEAWVTRSSVWAMADGSGVEVTEGRAASGGLRNDFQLWDLGANAPLADATGLLLAFDFMLSGTSALPALSLSTVGVSYDVALFSSTVETAGGALSAAYGPIAPFPSEGYIVNGDTSLLGSFQQVFSLSFAERVNGLLTMGFGVSAAKAGDATGSLVITGVRWVAGALPAGGLAVRWETGELLPVSVVPEPASLPLSLGGVCALLGWMRLRRQARLQGR